MWVVFKIDITDYERSCMVYKSEVEAENALQKSWEEALNDALASENQIPDYPYLRKVDMEQTYHEDNYAILSFDNGDRTEWFCEMATGI